MGDRATIKCGVCGLLAPALVSGLPPTVGCLHEEDVRSSGRCDGATILILEHALRRAVVPDAFDADGAILAGRLAEVLTKGARAFAASRRAMSDEARNG